jgi:hypothetical protein
MQINGNVSINPETVFLSSSILSPNLLCARVEISTVEQKGDCWVVRGTCPIDLEGHPWAEKFEIVVDQKGKIKSTDFVLL